MYTQCPKCKSMFRVGETQLTARNGLVRCGQCQEVFNASWNLVDDVPAVVTKGREPLAGGVVSPGAPTADGGAPATSRSAGGEQVELFGSDAVVRGQSGGERRKRGTRSGGETDQLLPSAMPFAIVEDDNLTAAHTGRPEGSVEAAGKGAAEPTEGDGEETAAVARRQEAGAGDDGARAEMQDETPLEVADKDAGTESASVSIVEIAEPIPAVDECQAEVSLEAEAVDVGSRPDDERVAMGLQPGSAAEEQPDQAQEPVTPGPPVPPEEEHASLALEPAEVNEPAERGAAEPSLADLFAAAEEQLGGEDKGNGIRKAVATSAPMGDLFAPADGAPPQETDGAALNGEESSEPAMPLVSEADAGDGVPDRAEPKVPFDTPDAEEIVIEAPAMLWDAFRDEAPGGSGADEQDHLDEHETAAEDAAATAPNDSRLGPPPPQPGAGGHAGGQAPSQQSATAAALGARLRQSRDMKLVHLPRRQPLKTAAWILAAVALVGAGLWQAKTYYLGSLSQVSALRPYVAALCDVLSCSVPPRSAFNLIDLVGTSVNTHPETPGALRVSVNLVNRAEFEQAYPPLEITLSDKSGRIVGRRTYLPGDYLTDPASLLVPRVIQEVDIDLAQPSENAVGYEIQLVAR